MLDLRRFIPGRGRLFSPEEFHDPTQPEPIDLNKNVDFANANLRIAEIVSRPLTVEQSQKGLNELKKLIEARNIQLGRINNPSEFPNEPNTQTVKDTYNRELHRLKEINRELEAKLSAQKAA